MEKMVIFGTGESARKVLQAIQDPVEIVAFADNDFNKHGQLYEGVLIRNPKELKHLTFDIVIISNIKYLSIEKQLCEIGVAKEKIFAYYDIEAINKGIFQKCVNGYIFLKDNYELKFRQFTIKMNNMPYEIAQQNREASIHVKSIEETMKYLLEHRVSISRFGDGEMKLIAGKDIGFQKCSDKLVERLKEVLVTSVENHIVGILNVFGDLSMYTEELQTYFRTYLYEYNREFQFALLDQNRTYYDAFITRPYISYKDRSHTKGVFAQFKALWQDQDVLIVEGDRTRLGRGNDLFDNVKSIRRIICPNEDAFAAYENILEMVKKNCHNTLVLLALGPTATVLAYDLAKEGIWTLDIGHIDLEYEWYCMGATEKVVVKHKYTNEVFGGNGNEGFVDKEYEGQIVGRTD